MNFIFPAAKDLMMTKQLDLLTDPIVGVLVSAGYTPSQQHVSLADVPVAARVALTGTLENRTVSAGVFNADPATAIQVFGNDVTAVVLVKHSGTDTSSPLVAYFDQGSAFPVNPAGGNVVFNWDTTAYKIFAL